MLIKTGLGVSQMSGTMGGVVASHNRFGQYFRAWRKPTDPKTASQVTRRAALAEGVAAWKLLTDANRTSWNNYAAATPWTNRLGETTHLTGMQMFVRSYCYFAYLANETGQDPLVFDSVESLGGLPQNVAQAVASLSVATPHPQSQPTAQRHQTAKIKFPISFINNVLMNCIMGKTLDKILGIGRKAVVGGMIAAAGVGLLGKTKSAEGELIRVNDWSYFAQGAINEKQLNNYNDFTDNDNVPSDKNYKIGFSASDSLGDFICGYAKNNNRNIQNLTGAYVDMFDGQRPSGMIVTHDLGTEGIGNFDTITEDFFIDSDDKSYIVGNFMGLVSGGTYGSESYFGKVELNGTLDIFELPSWVGSSSSVYLPQINLVDIPEPATITLLGLGGGILAGSGLYKRKK